MGSSDIALPESRTLRAKFDEPLWLAVMMPCGAGRSITLSPVPDWVTGSKDENWEKKSSVSVSSDGSSLVSLGSGDSLVSASLVSGSLVSASLVSTSLVSGGSLVSAGVRLASCGDEFGALYGAPPLASSVPVPVPGSEPSSQPLAAAVRKRTATPAANIKRRKRPGGIAVLKGLWSLGSGWA
ncbi:hypothetical protein GCM10010403_26940 [Glycomyces rutgersensis]|uniref:Uncharacterized protein n=1 Tax=Glycomyces rutgersensis TaxID=58115 RepID=A0ABN3FN21_9ACTN